MAIIMRNGLEADFDPNKMRAGELAIVTDARELHATFAPGDSPKVLLDGEAVPNPETAGTEGQVLALDENGDPEWKSVAAPSDAQVDAAVDDWLDAHPEATTTVQDGAITYAKLDSNLKGTVDDVSELKSDITSLYEGELDKTALGIVVGSLYTSGGYNANIQYRVATQTSVTAQTDITLYPLNGWRIYIYYFNSGGTKIAQYGWLTDPHTIPKNTIFRLVIARVTENTSETAVVSTYLAGVTFAVPIEKQIIDLQDLIESNDSDVDSKIDTVYDGDYVAKMTATAGVTLDSVAVGSVVDLSGLDSSGSHWAVLIENICVGECFYVNVTDGAVRLPWAFMDDDYKLISKASDAEASDAELIAPSGAKYLLIQCGNVHIANAKVIRYSSFSECEKSIDIVYQNKYTSMVDLLENASNSAKNDTSTAVKSRANLLNLIHFSDIHGSVNNIKRILKFADEYDDYISDILHTGDSPATYFGQNNPFATVGGDEILNTIGNHDCWIEGDTWPSPYNATSAQVYEKFFEPYISNWGVTSAGEDLCYYYKDYATANLRLIVLDALHYDSAQETWFTSALNGAISAGYRVVVATHYASQTGITGINCTFNSITSTLDPVATPEQGTQMERMPESAFTVVDSFISGGGEFVCWLSGHTHDDYIGVVTGHTDQIQIVISTARTSNKYSDCARTELTKSQDLFNVFTVDGNAKLIKLIRVGSTMDKFLRKRESLCINYNTKAVISNN